MKPLDLLCDVRVFSLSTCAEDSAEEVANALLKSQRPYLMLARGKYLYCLERVEENLDFPKMAFRDFFAGKAPRIKAVVRELARHPDFSEIYPKALKEPIFLEWGKLGFLLFAVAPFAN